MAIGMLDDRPSHLSSAGLIMIVARRVSRRVRTKPRSLWRAHLRRIGRGHWLSRPRLHFRCSMAIIKKRFASRRCRPRPRAIYLALDRAGHYPF